jgi:hypothetical protein
MTNYGFNLAMQSAEELSVGFLYMSPDAEFDSVSKHLISAGKERLASLVY